jgi:hypothetical protein
MNTYHAWYRGKEMELQARSSLEAQTKAAAHFKARHDWDVTIMLVALASGKKVVHSASDF